MSSVADPDTHFRVLDIGQDELRRNIPEESIRIISQAQRDAMFGHKFASYRDRDGETQIVLSRLKEYSAFVAEYFASKASRTSEFVFRLIHPDGEDFQTVRPSYSALSYRWVSASKDEHNLPTTPLLWAAALRLLEPGEGIWVDAHCIDQADTAEKTISIGLMDMIYEEARCAIIPLADVRVTREEEDCLKSVVNGFVWNEGILWSFVEPEGDLLSRKFFFEKYPLCWPIFCKIVASEYFQRAWCNHEYRLSIQHKLLIQNTAINQVLMISGDSLRKFVLLNSALVHPGRLPSHEEYERVASAYTVIRARDEPTVDVSGSAKENQFRSLMVDFDALSSSRCGGDPDPILSQQQKERTAHRDRMVISLNISRTNLTVRQEPYMRTSSKVDEHSLLEHQRAILLVSLARRDALALCSTGAPLPRALRYNSTSWLGAVMSPSLRSNEEYPTLPHDHKIRICPNDPDKSLQIEMSVLVANLRAPGNEWIELAEDIISGLLDDDKHCDRETSYLAWYYRRDTVAKVQRLAGAGGLRLLASTFACILQLGPSWIRDSFAAWENKDGGKLTDHGLFQVLNDPLRADIQHAPSMSPEAQRTLLIESRSNPEDYEIFLWRLYCQLHLAWDLLACPVMRDVESSIQHNHKPALVSLDHGHSYRHIMLVDPMQLRAGNMLRPFAIPTPLLDDKFVVLPRVWTVDWAFVDGGKHLSLLHKSGLIGPSLGEAGRSQQLRIYGAPKDLSQLVHGLTRLPWGVDVFHWAAEHVPTANQDLGPSALPQLDPATGLSTEYNVWKNVPEHLLKRIGDLPCPPLRTACDDGLSAEPLLRNSDEQRAHAERSEETLGSGGSLRTHAEVEGAPIFSILRG